MLNCGRNAYTNTAQATPASRYKNYLFWRDRLNLVKQTIHSAKPDATGFQEDTLSQFWGWQRALKQNYTAVTFAQVQGFTDAENHTLGAIFYDKSRFFRITQFFFDDRKPSCNLAALAEFARPK